MRKNKQWRETLEGHRQGDVPGESEAKTEELGPPPLALLEPPGPPTQSQEREDGQDREHDEDTIDDEVEPAQAQGSLGRLPRQQAGESVLQRLEARGNQAAGVHQQDRAPVSLRLDKQKRVGIVVRPTMPDGWDTRKCSIVPA